MLNIFIAINTALMCILMFSITYKVNGINRTVSKLPYSVIEQSIPLINEDNHIVLYFDKELLKQSYEEYLDKNIKKYADSYEVSYYFYNTENKGVCDIKDCQGVEINVRAKLIFSIDYERVLFYEISKGKNHG